MAGGLALPAAFAFGSDLDPARWWAWRRQLTVSSVLLLCGTLCTNVSLFLSSPSPSPTSSRLARRRARRANEASGRYPARPPRHAVTMSPDATVCGQAEASCCWSASPPHCPCSSRCTPAAAASRMLRTAPSESRHARHYGRLHGRLRLSCRIQRPRHCRLRHCPRPLPALAAAALIAAAHTPPYRHRYAHYADANPRWCAPVRPPDRPPARCRPRLRSQLP